MKRIVSVLLILVLVLSFAGCSDDKGRILFNVDLEDYVKLGEYMGIKVDKSSKEFETTRANMITSDVETYGLYVIKKEGKVAKGDVANIDYVGKKDGVAFEGGTAQGYNLSIGSGTFIDGFEDGLIGKEIGSTVDLNLTFPENYGKDELNGAKVVFTVKINYVTTNKAKDPKDYYMSLGFTSLDEYNQYVEKRTVLETLQQAILEDTEVSDYPQADVDFLYKKYYEQFEDTLYNNYGITVKDYLSSSNATEDQLKEELISQQVKPVMKMQMTWYAIFDKEGMEITKEDTEQTIKDIIAGEGDSSVERADIIERYGEYYIEIVTVSEKVFDFVEKNAKIS